MERVSVWPWYTDNSKDKETALLQTCPIYLCSLCLQRSQCIKHKGHHKKELEKEACEIGVGKISLGENPKVRSFKVVEIGWNFGSKIMQRAYRFRLLQTTRTNLKSNSYHEHERRGEYECYYSLSADVVGVPHVAAQTHSYFMLVLSSGPCTQNQLFTQKIGFILMMVSFLRGMD